MASIKQYTRQYFSLLTGILLVMFLFLIVSDVLFQVDILNKNDRTVMELYKDGKKDSAGQTNEKEFSEEGGDWYTQKSVLLCFGYQNERVVHLKPAPAMSPWVNNIHLPPPKFILI